MMNNSCMHKNPLIETSMSKKLDTVIIKRGMPAIMVF